VPHTGQCFCGQIRFTIDAEPIATRMCWCRDCQRVASGSAMVNVVFAEDIVTFTGEIATIERIADSGNTAERGFCSRCGTQIYSRMLAPKGNVLVIRAGTLDDPELMAPQAVIWTSSAPSWAVFDPELPYYPRGPQ